MPRKSTRLSNKLAQNLLRELIEEGTRIQPRFKPEPVYAKTGKGYLAPSGVNEMGEAKLRQKRINDFR